MTERHRVGPLAELAEDEGRRVDVEGRPVAVFRKGSRVFAVSDTCPHAGASLSEGFLDGNLVICPWHGWSFDLDTGVSPLDEDERVERFRVLVEDGVVYIETEGDS